MRSVTIFFPLKMNSGNGTSLEEEGCNLLHFYVFGLASEYENEQGLELLCGTWPVESCALLSQGQTWEPWVSSGQNYVLSHGQLCSGVVLLEMRWEWCPMPFSCRLSLSLQLGALLPSQRKLLPNSVNSREDLECWIPFSYVVFIDFFIYNLPYVLTFV